MVIDFREEKKNSTSACNSLKYWICGVLQVVETKIDIKLKIHQAKLARVDWTGDPLDSAVKNIE